MIPSDFRDAQLYALATLVVGAVPFAVVWFTRREQLRRVPRQGVDAW